MSSVRIPPLPMWALILFSFLTMAVEGFFQFNDNELVDGPTFDCGADSIAVRLQTKNPFKGNVYVRNHFHLPECRGNFVDNNEMLVNLTVKLGSCGIQMMRKPDHYGMNVSMVVVISFHPLFETRYDQAVAVNCFYKNDPINVSWDISVNDNRQQHPMNALNQVRENKCAYSIRADTFDGPVVRFAEVGGPVVHRWECEDPSMGILVRNCIARTQNGIAEEVIDDRGCPTSPIFDQLTYDPQLNYAFVIAEVFKFPDNENIGFTCNISSCNKHQNECLGFTPPNCPSVTRKEFKPESIVEESVDPTMVIIPRSTQRPFGGSDGRFAQSFFQPVDHRFPLPGRRQKDFVPSTKSEDPHAERLSATQGPPAIAPFSAYEARMAAKRNSTDSILMLKPRRPTDAPVRSVFNLPTGERNARLRRAEEHSVEANILVAEPDAVVTSNPKKRHVVLPTVVEAEEAVCLNRQQAAVVVVVCALLSAISLSMSAYVVFDICSTRHRRMKAPINTRSDRFEGGVSIKAFNSLRSH